MIKKQVSKMLVSRSGMFESVDKIKRGWIDFWIIKLIL